MVSFPHDKKAGDISKVMMKNENKITLKAPHKDKKFYPDYLSEIIFFMIICVQILIIIALLFPPEAGRQIDFSRPFQPLPEWYFLWLFKLVSYFPGDIAFIGTFIMPLVFILLLFSIPFIDKGLHGRLKACIAGIIVLSAFIILTLLSVF